MIENFICDEMILYRHHVHESMDQICHARMANTELKDQNP